MENRAASKILSYSKAELDELQQRIMPHFIRSEVRQRSRRYLEALLSRAARKNCWQLSEAAQEKTPYGMQRLLGNARWNPDKVRDDLRNYVVEHLGGQDGVLVVDETGFLKKGKKSAGVKRQYCGTAGKIENCQVGVFLAYASPKGKAFIDRELYLPEDWTADRARREEAGVPDNIAFAKKSDLARRMLGRAIAASVPFQWVVADEVYGNDRDLRRWLEKEEKPYVLAVASNQYVWCEGFQEKQVKKIAGDFGEEDWVRLSAGEGAKGPRLYDWAWRRLPPVGLVLRPGWGRWLLVRRSIAKPEEVAYYIAASPEGVGITDLVKVAGKRWAIEIAFEEAKGEAGLDEYEVRKWGGWYRHITLSMLAHAYLSVVRWDAGKKGM